MAASSRPHPHGDRFRLALGGVVLALGIQAIVTQSLLLREALVLMFGSELAWGVVLFAWLVGVAAGGAFGGWLESKLRRPDLALAVVLAALSLAAFAEIWLFRGARGWLGAEPGELLPLSATLWAALLFVAPASLWVGMAFPLACRVVEQFEEKRPTGAGPLGRVYALESAGSLLGGAAFSFWAVEHLPPIQIAMLCAVVTFVSLAGLFAFTSRRSSATFVFGFLAIATLASFFLVGSSLHRYLVQRRWRDLAPGYELVADKESRYQNLVIGRLAEQYTLYTDGQVTADFPDPYTFTPLAHFWMCQHPSPHHVLVLGGGAEGLLSEILRHPVEQVDYVEPDPKQIEILAPYLSEVDRRALTNPRLHVHHTDGRFFVKTQRDRFDLVIARLPEPTSALRARFYTEEFFSELRRAMTDRSVLCMTATATPGTLTEVSGEYLASLRATIQSQFPEILIGWGHPAHILASTVPGLVTTRSDELIERWVGRGVSSEIFHPVWFEGATDWLDPLKILTREKELDRVQSVRISTDLHPVVYLQRLTLWDRMIGGGSGQILERLRSIRLSALVIGLAALLGLIVLVQRSRHGPRAGWASGAVTVSIATTGFSTMALSIIWLFAFQNLYGYVYQRIGWIIALFMGGLVIGCAWATWRSNRFTPLSDSPAVPPLCRWLVRVDVLLAVLAFAVPIVLPVLGALQISPLSFRLVEGSVSVLVAWTGVLGGAAFALAGGLQMADMGRAGKAAGSIVGADHAGACAGALLTGIVLVPVYGTVSAAMLLGGLKLASAALLIALKSAPSEEPDRADVQ